MTTNGRTTWLIWAAGTIFTLLFSGITILGNNIIANERMRIKDETEIRANTSLHAERISRLEECMLSVKGDLTLMKSDIREIMRAVVK